MKINSFRMVPHNNQQLSLRFCTRAVELPRHYQQKSMIISGCSKLHVEFLPMTGMIKSLPGYYTGINSAAGEGEKIFQKITSTLLIDYKLVSGYTTAVPCASLWFVEIATEITTINTFHNHLCPNPTTHLRYCKYQFSQPCENHWKSSLDFHMKSSKATWKNIVRSFFIIFLHLFQGEACFESTNPT